VGGTTTTNVYDGDGKRASQTVGSTTTSYFYDVGGGLPVVLSDGSRKYVWGLGLAYTVDSGNNAQVYQTDGLGSVKLWAKVHQTFRAKLHHESATME
jgi:hypothetical protein